MRERIRRLVIFGAVLLPLLISAGTRAAEEKNPPPANTTEPAKPGDPVKFYWYKNPAPYIGKEVWTLELMVGEEVPISVQALNTAGKDLSVCPGDWQYDGAVLQVAKIQDSCKGIMVKGLRASDKVILTAVYKGAKGNSIEASLKVRVGAKSPAAQSKPAPAPQKKN
jgi:hypothetical protein